MADRNVEILPVRIENHPDADRLEIAYVGDFQAIVGLGEYQSGELVAFIPSQTTVPEDVLRRLGLWNEEKGKGQLAGSGGQRVKEARLRGIVSHGLCYPVEGQSGKEGHYYVERSGEIKGVMPGDDVAEFLGVEKYVRPIPTAMSGQVFNAGQHRTVNYDIENIRRYPGVLREGEPVVVTEKLHGSLCQIGLMPPNMHDPEEGRVMISSKGQAKKGLCFRLSAEENHGNLYVRASRAFSVPEKTRAYFGDDYPDPVWVLGEVFGKGVQKGFHYGANAGQDETIGFRVFDLKIGERYASYDEMKRFCEEAGLPAVPVLAREGYSKSRVQELTDGASTLAGHIREGVVVRTAHERHDEDIGYHAHPERVILKSISDDYLTRGGGTEHS